MTVLGRIDIHYPDGRSETYRLGATTQFTIGSAADNSIQLSDAGLAPRHLRFQPAGRVFPDQSGRPPLATTLNGIAPRAPQRTTAAPRCRANSSGRFAHRLQPQQRGQPVAMARSAKRRSRRRPDFRAEARNRQSQSLAVFSARFDVALSVTNLDDDDGLFRLETGRDCLSEWTTPQRLTFSVAGNDAVDLASDQTDSTRWTARRANIRSSRLSRLDEPGSAVNSCCWSKLGGCRRLERRA